MRKRIISRKTKSSRARFLSLAQKDKPRICVKRRLGGIGDVIMSLPSLKAIKQYYPNSHLVYATDTKYANGALEKIIQHSPYVNKVIHYKDIVDREFDYIADITSTGLRFEKAKTLPKNRIDYFAEEIGIEVLEDPIPEYCVTQEERAKANDFIKRSFNRDREDIKVVLVQARSNDVRRTWPLEKTQELVNRLASKDTYVILCDWKRDFRWKLNKNTIRHEGKFELTAALAEQSDLVICPDSSVLHLAGAFRKPTIAIFGPIHPQCRCNHYPTVKPIALKLRCSYCFYTPKCKKENPPYMDCLNRISSDKIYKEALEALERGIVISPDISYGAEVTQHKTDNIVLVKRATSGIGDLVMATNGIEKVKKRFPGKELHVAVKRNLMPILENNPYIDKIIDISNPINPRRYFATIDISSPCAHYESTRVRLGKQVQKTRVEVFAEAMGVRNMITDIKPRFYLSEEEIRQGKRLLKTLPRNKLKICVALSSAELYRNYTHVEDLIKLLRYKGLCPIILDKNSQAKDIKAYGNKSIREAASVLYASDGLITVDTGWLHIGAALNKKIISIFGPIDYRSRCKQYDNVKVLVPDIKCSPCWRNSSIKCKKTKTIESSYCMGMIKPITIVKTAIEYFRSDQ